MKRRIMISILSAFIICSLTILVAQAKNATDTWLGVYTQTIDEDLKEAFDLDRDSGVIIKFVIPDSPADKAGLKQGDIIVKFNGQSLVDSDELAKEVRNLNPGDNVEIFIIRDGEKRTITAELGSDDEQDDQAEEKFRWFGKSRPYSKSYTFKDYQASQTYIGVNLQNLNKQLGEYFGVDEGKGTLITEVFEDSPAEKAGLKAGDVIVEVDGKDVENSGDVQEAVREKDEGESVNLSLLRNKKKMELSVTLEKTPDSFGQSFMYQFPNWNDFHSFTPRMKGMFPGDWDEGDFYIDELNESMKGLQKEMEKLKKELNDLKEKIN